MKKQEFLKLVNKLEVCYQKRMSKEQLEVWIEFFINWDKEEFSKAINNSISICKFFPTIADINEAKKPKLMDI